MNIIKPKIKFTKDYIFENNIYKNALFTKNPENKVIIEDIDFDSCIIKNIDFSLIELINVNFLDCIFESCDLSNKNFDEKLIERCEFNSCKLLGSSFINASLKDILIDNSTLIINVIIESNPIVSYIKKNYQDPELNLKNTAEALFISTSYVQTLLKNRQTSFSKLLDEIRMKKAMELLKKEKDLKVYEVAYMVGLNSSQYFSKKFKQFYGVEPKTITKSRNKNEK